MADKNKINGWFVCENCHGLGVDNGRPCRNCKGWGVGWFGANCWFFVDWPTRWQKLKEKLISQKILNILDVLIYLAAISGVIVIVWYIGQATGWFINWSAVGTVDWWIQPVWPLRWLAWSVVFDLLTVYRLIKNSQIARLPRWPDVEVAMPLDWPGVFELPSRNKLNVIDYLPQEIFSSLARATVRAGQNKVDQVSPEGWFGVLLNDSLVKALLFRLNLNGQDIADKLKKYEVKGENHSLTVSLSSEVKIALIQGVASAWSTNDLPLSVDFLAPLIHHSSLVKEIIYDLGAKEEQFAAVANWFHINRHLAKTYKQMRDLAQFKPSSNMDRAYTAKATPFLNHYAHDLTLAAKNNQLPLCVARQKELSQILDAWSAGRLGIILVGSAGVGKTSLVYGLAQLMVEENVPSFLQDKRLVEVDVPSLIGGVSPEEAQAKLERIIVEVNQAGNIILFFDQVDKIAGLTVGEEQSLDLSDILANALQRGALRCITTASMENYRKYIAERSLGANLAKIDVTEPDDQQLMIMAEHWASYWEKRWGVVFTYAALETAKMVSGRYTTEPAQPTRLLGVLEGSARLALRQPGVKLVSEAVVREYASKEFGVPIEQVGREESEMLLNLEEIIHKRLIGQEEAVNMVAASLRRARVELRDTNKPIANFLFLGPTGVGKTELAKTLAEVYFGDEEAMIRLDMSEYQLLGSVNKMIGHDEEAGYLTEAVRQHPFSLILLDEIEKAHSDILNLFLQVFDDGRLTDAQGRTIDFSNTIIIATSNAGAPYIMEAVQQGVDFNAIRQHIIDNELVQVMRPELINRFDGIVVFRPLTMEDMVAITNLQLQKIGRQLAEKNINFEVTEQGLAYLAKAGYDPKFGARPLRRLLQDTINNVLAEKLLAKELKRRDTVIINEDGQIEIRSAQQL